VTPGLDILDGTNCNEQRVWHVLLRRTNGKVPQVQGDKAFKAQKHSLQLLEPRRYIAASSPSPGSRSARTPTLMQIWLQYFEQLEKSVARAL